MHIDLPYGNSRRTVRIPDDVKVDFLTPVEGPFIEDPEAALRRAFSKPVDSDPLDKLIGEDSNVVILISDLTRDGGTVLLLPLCIKYLKERGIKAANIRILIARGTHRKLLKEERQFFREGELKGTSLLEHDCDDSGSMEALLLTTRGTPVRVNRALKEASLVILLAPVSFHYFAGFGGGRKLILPGCADRQSILANHRLSLLDTTPVKLNPLAHAAVLDGNPVHEDMCEALDALENIFAINFFSNTSGKIAFLNAGSPRLSHREACEQYQQKFSITVDKPCDILLLSAGGGPYDINLLQSHKALRHASGIVKKGGTILFLAECGEGVGSEMFESALQKPKDKFLKRAYKDYELNNQAAVSLHNLADEFQIGMVTELSRDWLDRCGIAFCENVEAFVADSLSRIGEPRVGVLAHGSKTLPKIAEEPAI